MTKYVVGVVHTALNHYTVEAETVKEALDKAWEAFQQDAPETILGNEYDNAEEFYIEHYRPELAVLDEPKPDPMYDIKAVGEYLTNTPRPRIHIEGALRQEEPVPENMPVLNVEDPDPETTVQDGRILDALDEHAKIVKAVTEKTLKEAGLELTKAPDPIQEAIRRGRQLQNKMFDKKP